MEGNLILLENLDFRGGVLFKIVFPLLYNKMTTTLYGDNVLVHPATVYGNVVYLFPNSDIFIVVIKHNLT